METERTITDEDLKKLGVGQRIVGKTPEYVGNDLSHLYRPLLIVKNDIKKRRFFVLYMTSKPKTGERYHRIYRSQEIEDDINIYVNVSKVFELSYDDVTEIAVRHNSINEMLDIRRQLSKYIIDFEKIDYDEISNYMCVGTVFMLNNELFMVTRHNQKRVQYRKLIETNGKGIRLNSKTYILDFSKEYNEPRSVVKNRILNLNFAETTMLFKKRYSYGDICDSKIGKVIYIGMSNNTIYYCTLDNIKFFTGINRVDLNEFDGIKTGELSEEEKKKLAKRIYTYLSKRGFSKYSDSLNKTIKGYLD